MKYIKLFEKHSDYEEYKDGNDYVKPNLSYCKDDVDFHCDTNDEDKLVLVYNRRPYDFNHTLRFFSSATNIKSIEVDGEILSEVVSEMSFPANTSEVPVYHVVKCTLKDPTYLERYFLYSVTSILSITLPRSIKKLEQFAKYGGYTSNVSLLTSVNIHDINEFVKMKVYGIGASLISGYYYTNNNVRSKHYPKLYLNGEEVTKLVIPEGVTELDAYLFYQYGGVTSVTLPSTLIKISPSDINPFAECPNLTSVTVDDNNPVFGTIDGYNGIINKETDTLLIGLSTNLPDGVKHISSNAFVGPEWETVTSVTIPDSVRTIGNDVFRNCKNLTSITFGENIRRIGAVSSGILYYCPIESITILNPNPPYITSGGPPALPEGFNSNGTLYVPSGSLDAYRQADVWKWVTNIQEIS